MGSSLPISPFQRFLDVVRAAEAANDNVELTLRLVKGGGGAEVAESAVAGAEGAEAVSLATEAVNTVATVTEVGAATSYAVALAPAAVLFLAGDSSPRMPKILPVVDKPPQGQTAPAWMTQIDDLANKMQQISEMQQLIRIYQMYGLTSLADKVRCDLEGLQLQMTTSATSYPMMGNRLQIKASAAGSSDVDRMGEMKQTIEDLRLQLRDAVLDNNAGVENQDVIDQLRVRIGDLQNQFDRLSAQNNPVGVVSDGDLITNAERAAMQLAQRQQSLVGRAEYAVQEVMQGVREWPLLSVVDATIVAEAGYGLNFALWWAHHLYPNMISDHSTSPVAAIGMGLATFMGVRLLSAGSKSLKALLESIWLEIPVAVLAAITPFALVYKIYPELPGYMYSTLAFLQTIALKMGPVARMNKLRGEKDKERIVAEQNAAEQRRLATMNTHQLIEEVVKEISHQLDSANWSILSIDKSSLKTAIYLLDHALFQQFNVRGAQMVPVVFWWYYAQLQPSPDHVRIALYLLGILGGSAESAIPEIQKMAESASKMKVEKGEFEIIIAHIRADADRIRNSSRFTDPQ